MKSLNQSPGDLGWRQSDGTRRDSELRHGDEIYALLRWHSAFKALASGETADGTWKFKLEGFLFKQWVTIHPAGGDEIIAVFQALPSLNGVLEFAHGPSYYWDSNFWLTKWIWTDTDGSELMRVHRNLSLRAEGTVEIEPQWAETPEIPLLTVLGWYLIILLTDIRLG